jgi:AraC-like DNA-binding protein
VQISILIARAFAYELVRRGIAIEDFARDVDIDPKVLDDPGVRLSAAHYERIAEHALAITNDPYLGLHVGARTPASAFTVLGHLITSSATLRDASESFHRYQSLLVDGATWDLRVDGGVATQSLDLPPELGLHQGLGVDFGLAFTATIMRSFVGEVKLAEVCFAREAPPDVRPYEEFFGTSVRFGARENALRYPAELLSRRQLHTDAGLREMLERRADSMLADLRSTDRLPARIRDFIATHPKPNAVTVKAVAEAFEIRERTLRRRLLDVGLSFRDLSDVTLRDMACAALREEATSIKEIAFRLGFTDLSTFYRAFKRWTGFTPAEFRARVAD